MYLGDLLPCPTLPDQARSLTTPTFIFLPPSNTCSASFSQRAVRDKHFLIQRLLLTFQQLEVQDVNVERVEFLCCFFSYLLAYFCHLLSPNCSICASSREWHWGARNKFLDQLQYSCKRSNVVFTVTPKVLKTQLSSNTAKLNVPGFTTQHNLDWTLQGYRLLTKISLTQTRDSVFHSQRNKQQNISKNYSRTAKSFSQSPQKQLICCNEKG